MRGLNSKTHRFEFVDSSSLSIFFWQMMKLLTSDYETSCCNRTSETSGTADPHQRAFWFLQREREDERDQLETCVTSSENRRTVDCRSNMFSDCDSPNLLHDHPWLVIWILVGRLITMSAVQAPFCLRMTSVWWGSWYEGRIFDGEMHRNKALLLLNERVTR